MDFGIETTLSSIGRQPRGGQNEQRFQAASIPYEPPLPPTPSFARDARLEMTKRLGITSPPAPHKAWDPFRCLAAFVRLENEHGEHALVILANVWAARRDGGGSAGGRSKAGGPARERWAGDSVDADDAPKTG